MSTSELPAASCIAIIGMSGRWPRAANLDTFWRNVRDGVDCITRFAPTEMNVAGDARDADVVGARSILEGAELFDAGFFGILPREAELIDPQHRVFLECCWEAFEHAGHDPQTCKGSIGVYAGCGINTYFLRNVCGTPEAVKEFTCNYPVEGHMTLLGALSDTLATRVSYKLNLRGPSLTIQTACSTSLVAVCQACQGLLNYQCDMALAGGVSITFPQNRGYRYQEGGMGSADGRCRPFEATASGTVFGSGAGVVLLKRLEDALADGDHIHAVIRGFAINNDGSAKVGFTAPSVAGQSAVIATAHAVAEVDPRSIGYVEAHGTATPLGDPIEFQALAQAFQAGTDDRQFCALGSVKRLVGHLEIAAGVTGLIATVQALAHEQLPPMPGFEAPSPFIDIANSPFRINTQLEPWQRNGTPRRAGVSAFGVGGTNAHVVIEEAPAPAPRDDRRPGHLLVLSARSPEALETATTNLLAHLRAHPQTDLESVAFTLQTGRRAFEYRRALACRNPADAVEALELRGLDRFAKGTAGASPVVVFLFPGMGSQLVDMGAGLYRTLPEFRNDVDQCAEILARHMGRDLRTAMYTDAGAVQGGAGELEDAWLGVPALFVTEYALARQWMRWGVRPRAMLGHSVGELVAACLAGVFSLEDALAILATQGQLLQQLPEGRMLSVWLGADEIRPALNGELSFAALNGPNLSVVSGPVPAIEKLHKELRARSIPAQQLPSSHAFHSRMLAPILEPLEKHLQQVPRNPPQVPFLSGVTGDWITEAEATSPSYWARLLGEPVELARAIHHLNDGANKVFLELGPGQGLSTLMTLLAGAASQVKTFASLPMNTGAEDYLSLLQAAGSLWAHGVAIEWSALHEPGARRCPLPTYPFERQRYWIEPATAATTTGQPEATPLTASTEAPAQNIELTNLMPNVTPTAPPRRERIAKDLADIIADESGMETSEIAWSANFLSLGLDSLVLTQVAQTIGSKFGVKVAFRQLLDKESSVDALSAFIDARMPAEAAPAVPTPPPAAAPVPSSTPPLAILAPTVNGTAPTPPAGSLESIVREQLEAFSRLATKQLELLRAAGVSPAAPPQARSASDGTVPALALGACVPTPQARSASDGTVAPTPAPTTPTQEFTAFGPYKPVQRAPVGGLTEQQVRYLDTFIQTYTTRTAGSKKMTQESRRHLADPRAVSGFRAQWKELVYPIVTERSSGSRLWDVDGNEYIDILSGFGPIFFGHAPEFVTEAIEKQLKAGFEIGPQAALAGKVADLLCEITGNERVTFCNTGSEAVMAALRIARTVTGRKKVVLFAGAYHGIFDEVLVKPSRRGGQVGSLPIAPGIPPDSLGNVVVLDYGTAESLEYIRSHAGELAAVLVEPVQSRHPALRPVEFLREVRKITAAVGTALIFDEVVTGFRTHPGGAQALFDIRADLVTYGKVVGGGMPIGLLAGRAEFMDALDGGPWQFGDDSAPEKGVTFFAGTFVRHPLALAAAYAVLKRLKQAGPALQQGLAEKTEKLVASLNALFQETGVPSRVEHFASWFYFSFPADQPHGSLLYYHLRARGVYILEGFPCFLTTAHSEADLAAVVRAFRDSIAAMKAAGFWSGTVAPEPVPAPPLPKKPDAELPREVPLTEAQREVWLSAALGDDASCSFNESFTLHLRGKLNTAAFQETLQSLVDRHDALRATFDPMGQVLRIQDAVPVALRRVDLSAAATEEQSAQLRELIRQDATTPFDLVAGPLVRLTLVQFGPEQHILLFTTHHIVCDGWSTNVLLDELQALYTARCGGAAATLPEPMPFRAYALDQVKASSDSRRATVETWWLERFATPVSPLELPTDRPRPSVKSFRGDTVRRTIGAPLYQRLKQFGAQQGATLFATLLAGFKALLHRLTGQNDIVVGIPTAGQSQTDAESLVGHCVNFLPLRSSFEGNVTAAALVGQVRGVLLDAYEHQDYTYGTLVRKLGLIRDPSRLPLVEVQFNLEKVGSGMKLPELDVRVDPCPKSFVNFDLFLNAFESGSSLTLDCDYNRELFDPETIERWLGHLETLLERMAANPQQAVAAVPMLSAAERHQMLLDWNATAADYPREKCVHQLIAEQAARTPTAVAVVCGDRHLTYAELDGAANRLAHLLQKRGVMPGDRVAVCLERSPEMLLAVLAVLKTGAAYVPLDPEFPRERITAVLEDARPSLVLTQQQVATRLELTGPNVICLRPGLPEAAQESDQPLAVTMTPDALAYVIFTSGSTGRPKGVQVPHRAVVNMLCSMARQPGLTATDTLLAVTTLAFDIAVLELFLPLSVGARVVVATRDTVSDGHRLLSLLRSSAATVMQATPATWRLLIEAGWKGPANLKVLCGGEALPRDLADALLERTDSVWNMYGPTETTVWSATSQVPAGSGPITIGPPIANTTFYVLDSHGQPVPIGVAGELHIGGDGVTVGYWDRRQLTAEQFIPDPFASSGNGRLYKTGDLTRYRPDGTLEFLGRLDNQVKVRGFRIETGEVEHALLQYPGVRECVVVAREDVPGDKRLVAYFVAADAAPASSDLRAFLAGKLPAYMVPSTFVALPALPRTPNGKIDRKNLPRPDAAGKAARPDVVAPKSPREQTLADICRAVLKVESVSIHDSLFELGADSIQVFQIVARANEAGLNLTPKLVLSERTIAAICAELETAARTPARAEPPQLAAVSRDRYRMQRSRLIEPGRAKE
jgi:amino acid adenylation domain-containing protein